MITIMIVSIMNIYTITNDKKASILGSALFCLLKYLIYTTIGKATMSVFLDVAPQMFTTVAV